MDGNRRFAKEQGKPSYEGHLAGHETLKNVGDWCLEAGVKYLTVFGFSTENWKRSGDEVEFLMKLFYRAVTEELETFNKKGIRLRILGRREGLSLELAEAFDKAEKSTAGNTNANLSLAINYGGRIEILDAVKKILTEGVSAEKITEELFASKLTTNGMPDPDLILRTSGEKRLSGFLTWQSVYSELIFIDKHWPALTREDFNAILEEFANRQRRFGK